MALENTFRVAIFDEFMDALVQLPREQQKKVNRFAKKFRANPTHPSINYESISTFVDPNLRTVRIDQAYRAIVLRPEEGNVYVLLWVDHHDKAMRWAERKKVRVHPETGALQVLSAEYGPLPEEPAADTPAVAPVGLLDHVRDRELLRLGVPEEALGHVRRLRSPADVEAARAVLPPEAWEAVLWLSEGESLEEVEQAMAVHAVPDVDTQDFGAALERPASRRRFVIVDDDELLEAMLDAPLEKWRVFLHPSQRALVERSWNGPVRVLGGAGTGKTVVAMHRATYLAEHVHAGPADRLLFTTFTRNLAADIRANLAKLCTPDTLRRIEVVNLDNWVGDLLRRAGYPYEIAYWDPSRGGILKELWESTLDLAPGAEGFPDSFFREEWTNVVQAAGCASEEDYVLASRAGRGTRISRRQRKAVWPVFEAYRNALERERVREPEDALRDAAVLVRDGTIQPRYRAAIVDEAQDMSTAAFSLLRAVVPEGPNDLFIVGDGHQRIYRRNVVLAHAGVAIQGRGRRLRVNYRTTDGIRAFAVALLEGMDVSDLDLGDDSTRGYRSLLHGPPPEVRILDTFDAEIQAIVGWLDGLTLSRTCLVARTNEQRDRYEEGLQAAGIETRRVSLNAPDDAAAPGLRLATMHRVKGLEYDNMIVAGLHETTRQLDRKLQETEDPTVRRELEQLERSLLYVALTRARQAALLTCCGPPSPWMRLEGAAEG